MARLIFLLRLYLFKETKYGPEITLVLHSASNLEKSIAGYNKISLDFGCTKKFKMLLEHTPSELTSNKNFVGKIKTQFLS